PQRPAVARPLGWTLVIPSGARPLRSAACTWALACRHGGATTDIDPVDQTRSRLGHRFGRLHHREERGECLDSAPPPGWTNCNHELRAGRFDHLCVAGPEGTLAERKGG